MSTLAIPHEAGGDAWDTLTLGGIRFDGVAVVSGDAFKKKIDKRRAAGADGARIVDKGARSTCPTPRSRSRASRRST